MTLFSHFEWYQAFLISRNVNLRKMGIILLTSPDIIVTVASEHQGLVGECLGWK